MTDELSNRQKQKALEESLKRILSKRLKKLRGPLNKTEFSARAAMSPMQYAQYENGKRLPSLPVLLRLIKMSNCAPGYLLGLKGDYDVSGSN